MANATSNPLKWHGGKQYLASWIIDHMPRRCTHPNAPREDDGGWLHYVEPYFGGGAVLFAQDPNGISEVVNDVNGRLTNFWQVLQAVPTFEKFKRIMDAMPISAVEWDAAKFQAAMEVRGPLDIDAAVAMFVQYRQSRQGLGKCFATLSRNRTRQGMNEQVSAWLSAVEGLPEAHERLKRVVILNDDAVKVIKSQDGPRTLFYLDPPYVHESRHKSATDACEHEMTEAQHVELLETLSGIEGRFLLSGYDSDLYHDFAQSRGWACDAKEIDNKASGAKTKEKKTECLWKNY